MSEYVIEVTCGYTVSVRLVHVPVSTHDMYRYLSMACGWYLGAFGFCAIFGFAFSLGAEEKGGGRGGKRVRKALGSGKGGRKALGSGKGGRKALGREERGRDEESGRGSQN